MNLSPIGNGRMGRLWQTVILNTIEEIIETEKRVTVKVTQKVTANQQKILDLIKENQFITQEELSKNIGIARKSVISNMKKLQDVGLINGLLKTFVNIGILDEKTGFNRNRYYVFEDYIKIFR